ncbi:myrosinase 1-like [Ceratina calcarata]|uniref:Myrosinase 1-like n=1 Tax=Ceratina calcarata TaxID=156304 RepID=A0AAJ7ISW9_9HYME|nr:myrosinase 1-like [Ceratina calcarata]
MVATLSLGSSALFLLAISASSESVVVDEKYLKFPPNFLLGTASASYQIEGAWNVSDKGESTWDHFTHLKGNRIFNDTNGDVAADFYHKYKEDIAILKNIGFKSYRFSVSWPRILPTGFANQVSKDGVQYYHNLIDELLKNGIEPLMTLYHWDHPQIMEEAGGWMNEEMVDWFADYARVIYREFGSKVKKFIPINEPISFCKNGYADGKDAPGKTLPGIGDYLCMHNVIKAHARAYRIYETEFKQTQKGQVGFLINFWAYMPKTPADQNAADLAFEFNVGWSMHPIYSKEGDYPAVMKSMIAKKSKEQGYLKSRLPTFTPDEIKYIRGTSDFLAVNHYSARLVTLGNTGKMPSRENDMGVVEIIDKSWKGSAVDWLFVVPEGFRYVLRQLAQYYGNPPMYITENGYADYGSLNDDDRIEYFREYLKQMHLAIYEDGVNVRGYILWSLTDTFEWLFGYNARFGIVSVDFNDPERPRTLRKSASWWKKVIADGKIDQ